MVSKTNLKTVSGQQVHPIGIGTWNICSLSLPENSHTKYRGVQPVYGNEEKEIDAIRYSISKGQNHIDCAEMYGGFYTDEVIGRAISGKPRDDLYIADKLWKTSVGKGKVNATVKQMLHKLGTSYIDLLYIHAPWEGIPWKEAVPQIDELIDRGIIRHFGVSNFNIQQMQEVMKSAKHPLIANQINFNVLYQNEADQSFRNFCKQYNIQIIAYQPIKRKEVLEDKTIHEIAKDYNATPIQIALAWLIQLGALPIPKTTNKAHIDENLKAIDINLSDKDLFKLVDKQL